MVRHLTGVQAQMLPAAELGLSARSEGLTRARIDRARLRDRSIVRTWAMRGTLHLIPSDDHGWLVPLLAEPGIANARRRLAQEGVSPSQADRAIPLIDRMLADDGPMTRREIAERLARRRIPVQGQAIAHLVWMAAATGAIVYGPDRDGESCFVSTRDWLDDPHTPRDRDDSLRELAIRYLRAHGPAAPQDLAAWSGLGVKGHQAGVVFDRRPPGPVPRSAGCGVDAPGLAHRRTRERRAAPAGVRRVPAGLARPFVRPRAGTGQLRQPRRRHDPPGADRRRAGRSNLANRRTATGARSLRAADASRPGGRSPPSRAGVERFLARS